MGNTMCSCGSWLGEGEVCSSSKHPCGALESFESRKACALPRGHRGRHDWEPAPDESRLDRSSGDVEVVDLFMAAEQIADGLADLTRVIYDLDNRWKDQPAAANAASVHMQEARREAERLPDDDDDG